MYRTVSILPAFLLAACANGLPGQPVASGFEKFADDPRLGEPVASICFASNIDGFSMNERNTVLLHEGGDRYMVELFGSCPDLEFAQSVGVVAASSCLSKGDALVVSDTFGGGSAQPRRCSVREIRAWNPKAVSETSPAEET